MLYRSIDTLIQKRLDPNKVVVIYGPRRVGKTTAITQFLAKTSLRYKLYTGDNVRVQKILGSQNFDQILPFVQDLDLLVLDEAQRIPNIGMGLKIIVDQISGIRVIATGSASFELAGQVGEPLTGRKWTLTMYPISQLELLREKRPFDLKEELEANLIYGSYPEVLLAKTIKKKRDIIQEISESYLLKDILELERVKSSSVLVDLLRLVALQVGNQVSLSELGSMVGLDYKTVGRYLDLLQKAFVLYELRGYSRNLRKEVRKKSKYYFWDTGIRNAILNNFNQLSLRSDVGTLWENFCVVERLKRQAYTSLYANNYFWRTWEKQEVDWVEERGGKVHGYEFTFSKKRKKTPTMWLNTYKEATYEVVNRENYLKFTTGKS